MSVRCRHIYRLDGERMVDEYVYDGTVKSKGFRSWELSVYDSIIRKGKEEKAEMLMVAWKGRK